jgi:hypothetical protein
MDRANRNIYRQKHDGQDRRVFLLPTTSQSKPLKPLDRSLWCCPTPSRVGNANLYRRPTQGSRGRQPWAISRNPGVDATSPGLIEPSRVSKL